MKIGSCIDIRYFEVVTVLVHFTRLEQLLKFWPNYKRILQLLHVVVTKYKIQKTKCHTYKKKQSYITHSNLLIFRWNKKFHKNWLNFPSISYETLLSCVWLMPSPFLPSFIVFLSKITIFSFFCEILFIKFPCELS